MGLGRQRQQCGLAAANGAAALWRAKRLNEQELHKHRMERSMSGIGQADQENHRRLGARCYRSRQSVVRQPDLMSPERQVPGKHLAVPAGSGRPGSDRGIDHNKAVID